MIGRLAENTQPMQESPFDGIVCFGGVDWWYHNRGHYDLQMMREFSKHFPVLYVNSIGMRVPRVSEGAMFLARIRRKLRSIRRGLVPVREQFFVFSPATLPGGRRGRLLRWATQRSLAAQVNWAARRCGIRRPLIWIACPPAVTVLDLLDGARLVYQRTDRFEAFAGVDPDLILAFDRDLKHRADLVLYCSRQMYHEERDQCRLASFIDHGVDFDRFAEAGHAAIDGGMEPDDLRSIGRPRVGFVGTIDAHTFDPPFFVSVAESLPELQFVMVGASSLSNDWCQLPNVHFFGQRPYEEVASYMAACDVLIMPWNRSEWIKACNPVKLKEYLATGRPVVSTWFSEIEHYRAHVSVEIETPGFVRAIKQAVLQPGDSEPRRDRVRGHTWESKAAEVGLLVRR